MAARTAEAKGRYLAAFENLRAHAGSPPWFADVRERAIARFEEMGFPTTRMEGWKYTDVTKAVDREYASTEVAPAISLDAIQPWLLDEAADSRLVFVDGRYSPALSSGGGLASVVAVDLLDALEAKVLGLRENFAVLVPYETEAFAALNTALTEGGAVISIPDGRIVEQTIHVLYVSSAGSAPTLSNPHTVVVAGKGSVARLVESFVSLGVGASFTNTVAEIAVGDGAMVEHYRVQNESLASLHVGSTDVRVGRGASYGSVSIALGAALSRHDLRVELADEHAACVIDGLYVMDGRRHCDSHTVIHHAVPRATSSQLYKGVLDGASRAVFNGKVVVHRDAQKSEAHQTNRNLLLSNGARVDTKPELEIFADDVVCSHGATVGALDEEEQFYLASRGLDEDTVRGLLTYGFAEEIIARIKTESLRRQLDAVILGRFRNGPDIR
jgi:Fe-S cluster assembly protein SufD